MSARETVPMDTETAALLDNETRRTDAVWAGLVREALAPGAQGGNETGWEVTSCGRAGALLMTTLFHPSEGSVTIYTQYPYDTLRILRAGADPSEHRIQAQLRRRLLLGLHHQGTTDDGAGPSEGSS